MRATILLSPHPDDAVLSCWHALTTTGQVTVVNIFAAIPDPAQAVSWWDRMTGATSSAERMRERLTEDRRALALARRQAVNLKFLDDQYRNRQPALDQIVEELQHHLAPKTAILAPAGIGEHPDHLLVRAAAIRLSDCGHEVALYAELPHAIRHGWPQHVRNGRQPASKGSAETYWQKGLSQVDRVLGPATIHTLDVRARASKINAVGTYRTQLDALNTIAYQPLDEPDTLRYEVVWQLRKSRLKTRWDPEASEATPNTGSGETKNLDLQVRKMHAHLNYYAAKQRTADLHRAAQRATVATEGGYDEDTDRPVTIRRSTDADLTSLRKIAELDSQRPPNPPFLVAEVRGEIVAALAIETGMIVADPFRHTAHVVVLLRLRAEQLAFTTRPARTALPRLRIRRAVIDPR